MSAINAVNAAAVGIPVKRRLWVVLQCLRGRLWTRKAVIVRWSVRMWHKVGRICLLL